MAHLRFLFAVVDGFVYAQPMPTEARKLYSARYYVEHREEILRKRKDEGYDARYFQENKEKCYAKHKKWYENHGKEYERQRYNKNKNIRLATIKKSQMKHRGKHLARKSLREAVRIGKITKPSRCTGCTKEFPKKLLCGHHENYSKRLDVVWLCHACHAKLHRS